MQQQEIAAEESVEAEAAVKIQAAFRGMQARKEVAVMREDKVTRHAITAVHVETLGGATEVTLSPREYTPDERKRLLASVAAPDTNDPTPRKRVKVSMLLLLTNTLTPTALSQDCSGEGIGRENLLLLGIQREGSGL